MVEEIQQAKVKRKLEGDVMNLPNLPNRIQRNQREIVAMRGINYSDNTRDGDLVYSQGLSTRRWPYMATRRARVKETRYPGYEDATAMTAWEKLVAVVGTDLIYDGEIVGTVLPGEKQFAAVNTKLVIWPDKVYLDMDSLEVKQLDPAIGVPGAVFTEDSMTVEGSMDLTRDFKAGDYVTISGCEDTDNNKSVTIKAVSEKTITAAEGTFEAGDELGNVMISRRIPELDYICASENRLFGCSNSARSVFASVLGDPTNFYVYEGLATDGYAVAVGSDGDFTGCCKLGDSVLFWKEKTLHKLLGSYPAEYTMSEFNVEGLQAGSHKSLQVIDETLFYLGIHGVHAYSGGVPVLISSGFGQKNYKNAAAGSDGEKYYLSVLEGDTPHLMVYDIEKGIWLREDGARCVDFARIGKDLYMLIDKSGIWKENGNRDEEGIEWEAAFTPFYETMEGKKRYSRLLIRTEIPKGSWMKVDVRHDGGKWKEAGKVIGQEHDTVNLRIAINRCDKFEIRMKGKGPCTVLGISREFSVRSDR